ncbi:autotransporter domain-containing protein [Candidatus Symbiopectobacterium sp.]|uniref:autotransporter domain-containing protein n=1 Tax=Candidatus Symbiopectobacterium sp. TaxID=2816440 RepID=UPI0025C61192|nr:autotransporter domain-containing protein [Candidatus Symbiopectobacterium sp.]
MPYALLDYTLSDSVTVGGSLSIMRKTDELERDGHLKSDTWQAGIYSLWHDRGPLWAAGDISSGRASIDTRSDVHIQSAGWPVLLDNTLSGETEAQFVSTCLMSGYDLSLCAWRTGPLVEMDYTHYRINGFDDRESLCTAVRYEEKNLNSLEVRLGWRVCGNIDLNATFSLHPYASVSWVNELADGLNDCFTVHTRDGGGACSVQVASQDKHFGRAALCLQWVTCISRD